MPSADRLIAKELRGGKIFFDKASVGASVNAVIMASCAEGDTEIHGSAKEPHVQAVIDFLKAAGADITIEKNVIKIKGKRLRGACIEIIPDMIEAGTYMLLAPITEGVITVVGDVGRYLESFFSVLRGCGVSVLSNDIKTEIHGSVNDHIEVTTEPYPGYPTDLQPQMCPIMANFFGGVIRETVWQGRFGYLESLSQFGIKYQRQDSLAAIIPSDLHRGVAQAQDLRGGAACIIAALAAKGESEILMPEVVLRGYSYLCEKLTALGADIKMIK